jgi:hypothetical protein
MQVDEFSDLFAFKPEGNFILTFRNEDRPGAISEVRLGFVFLASSVLLPAGICAIQL